MLRLEGVDVHIEGVHVLRGVSLDLAAGRTTALIGRNGAGKTTTLRTIMGFVRPTAGRIFLGADPLDDVAPHERPGRGIGYAPEDRRLFAAFDVEGNLRLPLEVAGTAPDEIRARLDQVYELLPEIAEMRARPAASVSGGQGKMVALGRALMLGTRVVLLDEPFQGLAPALAQRYAGALRRLMERRGELALLVTESNPGVLETLADRILTIERGEVVAVAEGSG